MVPILAAVVPAAPPLSGNYAKTVSKAVNKYALSQSNILRH
jgi:hypothetical protein